MISEVIGMLPQSTATAIATIRDGVLTNAAIDTSNLEICNYRK